MLNDESISIDDQEIILGFIDDEEHPDLRDFDSLWDSVVEQEKTNRANAKAADSMTREQKAAWLQKYAPETWQKLTDKRREGADVETKKRANSTVEHDNNLIQGKNYHNHIATWYGHVDVVSNALATIPCLTQSKYAYTGVKHEAQQMPVLFQNIAKDIEDQLMFPNNYFNCLLANLYTNKGKVLHSDNEPMFMNNDGTVGAVATISLGETAVATIARNDCSKDFKIKLTDGSCYLMPEGNFQNKYKHSVSAPLGRRISLTFRHIP